MLKPVVGTWFEFRHHNAAEGKYWNEICKNFTDEQWEELIADMADLGMKYMPMMCTSLVTNDEAEAYFETDIFPMADMKCKEPMSVMFDAADKYGIKIFVSCGFYGNFNTPYANMISEEVKERAFKAMKELYERYGHHESFYGWYLPDEKWVNPYFSEEFIKYVNAYTAYGRSLMPNAKTLIAPYGVANIIADEKYIEQLTRLDVDYVAYQDGIGVESATVEKSGEYFKALREAHDAAGRSKIWADVEFFGFEGQIYKSALIPANVERVMKQLEAVSPYVDEILCYQYQGIMNKPETKAYCGSGKSEELYNVIKEYNKKCSE